jgi:hypothetical protein
MQKEMPLRVRRLVLPHRVQHRHLVPGVRQHYNSPDVKDGMPFVALTLLLLFHF